MDGQRIGYGYLVLAIGAAHSYFGRDDGASYAPGLKRVEDATEVRRRRLAAFEKAEVTDDPAEQASLLTFHRRWRPHRRRTRRRHCRTGEVRHGERLSPL